MYGRRETLTGRGDCGEVKVKVMQEDGNEVESHFPPAGGDGHGIAALTAL